MVWISVARARTGSKEGGASHNQLRDSSPFPSSATLRTSVISKNCAWRSLISSEALETFAMVASWLCNSTFVLANSLLTTSCSCL